MNHYHFSKLKNNSTKKKKLLSTYLLKYIKVLIYILFILYVYITPIKLLFNWNYYYFFFILFYTLKGLNTFYINKIIINKFTFL